MKTKLQFLLSFIIIQTTVFAQTGLPSISSVYSDIKSNSRVYEKLKEEYKISNPKSCKIEMKMTIGGGDVIVSDWSTYKSQEGVRLNYYWPYDRAYTVFTVTTPESTDGVTYSLPLVVEYSRINNGTLQNNWSFYWWYFDTPYSSTGGKEDPLLYELLIAKLATIEGDLVPYRRSDIPSAIENFTTIKKIEKFDEPDLRKKYSNSENLTRTYSIYGETSKFVGTDDAVIESNYKDCISYLQVNFSKPKENGQEGDWAVEGIYGGFGTGIQQSTPTEDKNLYKTVGSHGFKAIFQKEKQAKAVPYFSERYQRNYAAELTPIIMDFYQNKEGAAEKLKKYIVPGGEGIFKSFEDYFAELETKMVKIKPSTNSPQHDGLLTRLYVEANQINDGYLMLYTNLERKSYSSEKGLKNAYKTAGMSKETLSKREGHYYKSENISFKIVLIDDQIKIASKLESRYTITF